MRILWNDLRYALRILTARPAFTAIAVLTMGLGIGANSAIFSVIDAVLLRPLPYPEADRIVEMEFTRTEGDSPLPAFECTGGYQTGEVNLTGHGRPERVQAVEVRGRFLEVLGVRPLLGAGFSENPDGVAIIGYGLWQRRFHGDPSVLGQSFFVEGKPVAVAGVMPRGFQYPEGAELWIPLGAGGNTLRKGVIVHRFIGRLRKGLPFAAARTELQATYRNLYPKSRREPGAMITPLQDSVAGESRRALLILLGAAAFVLLIACANVANLLLARAAERPREFAVRRALGASRWRLVRQLLTESVLLAALGGAFGLMAAVWSLDALVSILPMDVPKLNQIGIDARVLGFTLLVSMAAGVFFGLTPALTVSKPELISSLKDGAPGAALSRGRIRGLLVVAEVALGVVLVAGAALLIRTVHNLLSVAPGFVSDHVVAVDISRSAPGGDRAAQYFDEALRRVRAVPGVLSAGAVNYLPLARGNSFSLLFRREGQPLPFEKSVAVYHIATPGYFETLGIPLRRGRLLTERDTGQRRKVVLVNDEMAQRYWPGEDPIGKRIEPPGPPGKDNWLEVIGVVGDLKHWALDEEPRAEVYLAEAQEPVPYLTLVVRTAGDPIALVPEIRSRIHSVDPNQPIARFERMDDVVTRTIARQRSYMMLLTVFAALALVLAVVGIYGVVAYSVTQRTHELGVRRALGAQAGDLLRLVVGSGMGYVAAGILLGLGAAGALTRVLGSLLYGVKPADPVTLAAVAVLLTAAGLLASYLPARRALKVDRIAALKYE